MSRIKKTSEKKQKLIDQFNKSPFKVGERITALNKSINKYGDPEKEISAKIIKVNPKTLEVIEGDGSLRHQYPVIVKHSDVISRSVIDVGSDPFDRDSHDHVRSVNFTLESILFNLDVLGNKHEGSERYTLDEFDPPIPISELNWNPFVYDKDGNKQYYQRDFVWTIEDMQNLIESIYNGIDCGKILVRKRSWDELKELARKGETEVYFNDLVDGKQRLNAIKKFIDGDYPDLHGNYYGDLSYRAQSDLINNQLISYSEIPWDSTDEQVLKQFLKLNFAGVPQSKEHIEFVTSLRNKI